MKKFILFLFLGLPFIGCKKDMPEPPTEATSNTSGWGNAHFNQYNVTFFTSNFNFSYQIVVDFNGSTGVISQITNYDPGCGSGGTANFTVPDGTYSYSASGNGKTWYGTVKTGASQCITRTLN